jgi:hypothetical protein
MNESFSLKLIKIILDTLFHFEHAVLDSIPKNVQT